MTIAVCHRPLNSFPGTVFVTIGGRTYGKMGVSLGTEKRMKMPVFIRETEEGAWRLMRVGRTSDSRNRGDKRGVRE